ncbi:TetR/AcrR family transcriptional regulator [Robertmurraya yapensis]|uniref:TetR/AcrR family transcriptional regulator n=2 Tax=Bacillaceae TaxID=186817 RepID=A0A431VZ40_9BACI|nr:TetR/AcrR family transcriptional regulator [Bacillus yapensis]RTR28413.1 TetR/AcrR family transcriptional regulator [Bacillus yapensis]TKS94474.1 TetR/AcrR family transcriptional regulator [Bacillus yapensis]
MVKKLLIMEKALELFAKQGFEATSVQQITDYCGISKGAFYLSFKSKEELILELIDHFMKQFISDIDYSVKNTNKDDLLSAFFYATYQSFQEHSNFAKILIQEQAHSLSEEFLLRMRDYDHKLDKAILTMIERVYGPKIETIKYDLIYSIKGFVNNYSGLILFNNLPVDVDLLVRSLVEKTNILAQHMTIPFVSPEISTLLLRSKDEKVSKEQLIELLEQKLNELDESIEKESLSLLKQQLLEPSFSPAIVKGLLENIRNHPHCKWISYLLRDFFEI